LGIGNTGGYHLRENGEKIGKRKRGNVKEKKEQGKLKLKGSNKIYSKMKK
jgi:hypothetical protein